MGLFVDQNNPMTRGINGRPEYVKASCEHSLKKLGMDVIDLYYAHRIDPEVPLEEHWLALWLISSSKGRSVLLVYLKSTLI